MSRQVFPWDAFTTWMFRAKAWVTTDQAVDFATFNEWLVSGAGFTLPAAHYPISVSAVAAFAAAVSGGWSDQAASIPWFFVMTASALIMAGLCRLQTPNHPFAALAGAALLVTAPLVHWHGVLAGYADIWVMGTSGMGLAGICLWTQRKARSTLMAEFVAACPRMFMEIRGLALADTGLRGGDGVPFLATTVPLGLGHHCAGHGCARVRSACRSGATRSLGCN